MRLATFRVDVLTTYVITHNMSCDLTPFEALQAAVDKAGTQQAMADICGVSQTAVWKWLQSSKRLPAEYVLRVEAATGVSRHHLRPDIYPVDMPPAGSFRGVDQGLGRVSFDRVNISQRPRRKCAA